MDLEKVELLIKQQKRVLSSDVIPDILKVKNQIPCQHTRLKIMSMYSDNWK
jgi:hypothetical protein